MAIDIEASMADADEIIERSRRLTDRAKATKISAAESKEPFRRVPLIEVDEPQFNPQSAPPKHRWQTTLPKRPDVQKKRG